MAGDNSKNLNHAVEMLRECALLPGALKKFKLSADEINGELIQTIHRDIPGYVAEDHSNFTSHLNQHVKTHTRHIIDILGANKNANFDFVHEFNQQQENPLVSLESNLHLYRLCQKIYSHRLRDAVFNCAENKEKLGQTIAAIDDFILEYTDTISTLATQSYIEQTRILTEAEGDKRAELLSFLLEGHDNSDARINHILQESGYLDDGRLFCVAVAQSVDPKEMLNHERARRMADSIDKLFQSQHGHRLIDVRDNKVIVIFSALERIAGWTRPHPGLAEQISHDMAMLGNAAYVGVSNTTHHISRIPRAFNQALLALKLTKPTQRVICASRLSAYEIMVQFSGNSIQNSMPDWATEFYQTDDKSAGSLSASLRAYAKTNMNILKAGAVLSVHPNTIYSRFNKIHKLTGLDARRFNALTELLLICDVRDSKN